MSFSALGLSAPIVSAITDAGYRDPTAIQEQAIPAVLAGDDVIATAQTGTGKTAAFGLPILEMFAARPLALRGKRVRALVLAPTRELAIQVESNIARYSAQLDFATLAVVGGKDSDQQKQRLIEGVDILVATPGRLLDLARQRAVHFDELEVLVLDEADRMLDMGFIDEIEEVLDRLPVKRQNVLFTATLNDKVRDMADSFLEDAVEIALAKETAAPKIEQWLVTVDKDTKSALLSHLVKEQAWDQALIFIEKKHAAAKLVSQLEKRGITAEALHSGRSQASRQRVMDEFKSGTLKFLVATGIAARGIDIDRLSRVVNYDLPHLPDEYIHRIGRTGRAGETGEAISLVSKDDFKNLCVIESRLGHLIERREFEAFPVRKVVPVSILDYQPKRRPAKSTPYWKTD